jgi:hypothetical protein
VTQQIRAFALIACFSILALLFWKAGGLLGEEWIQLAVDYSESTLNPWRSLNPAATCLIAISAIFAFLATANLRHLVSVEPTRKYELAGIRYGMFACLLSSIILSMIFLLQTPLFVALSHEDGVIEYAQFLFFAATSIIWLFIAINTRNGLIFLKGISVALFFGFLFASGEEISWGQRIFGFDTPEILLANSQGEANLHNINSGIFNDLFLYGSFAFFGLAPFTYFASSSWCQNFHFLRPDTTLLLILAAGAGFHPGYANEFGQFLIFFGLTACLYQSMRTEFTLVYILGIITLCLAAFISFFRDGLLERWWQIDECRELFFSFGILIYSIDIARRLTCQSASHQRPG